MRLNGWEILKKICLVLYSKRDRLRDFSGGLFLSDFARIYKGIGLLLY